MPDKEPPFSAVAGPTVSNPFELEALRGATLGHYDILGELGRGGMATVYLAYDIALDRKVAIKVMSAALSMGDGIERFKREARTAASLGHPNIIPVYSVQHTERLLYFVMKFVDGRSLDSIIDELGPLPISMVQAILAQVAGAFGYAHRRGVVHRDIKPGNILIDDEGWVVVTDFGIAKVAQAPQLTSTGLSVGTPTYMSPEQVMGKPVTGASDQYSLGVVAYEMLTGKPPFEGAGAMAMLYAHVHEPAAPLETLRPDCPQGLRAAVMRMLAKEPNERWGSVEDILSVIGSPALTPDDSTRSQLIAIAKTGQRTSIAVTTPKSPIPLLRTPVPPVARTPFPSASATGVEPAATTVSSAPPPPRRTSALSLALAVGGILVGVGSIAVVLKSRTAAPLAGQRDSGAAPVAAPPPAAPGRPATEAGASAPRVKVANEVSPPTAPGSAPQPSEPAAAPRAEPPPPSVASPRAEKASAADRAAIEQAIQAFAAALDAANLSGAKQAFRSMPEAQESSLESLFSAGGHIRTIWRVSDVAVQGDRATARIRGATRTEPADSAPRDKSADLRAVLNRETGAWHLSGLTGAGAP